MIVLDVVLGVVPVIVLDIVPGVVLDVVPGVIPGVGLGPVCTSQTTPVAVRPSDNASGRRSFSGAVE